MIHRIPTSLFVFIVLGISLTCEAAKGNGKYWLGVNYLMRLASKHPDEARVVLRYVIIGIGVFIVLILITVLFALIMNAFDRSKTASDQARRMISRQPRRMISRQPSPWPRKSGSSTASTMDPHSKSEGENNADDR